MLSSSSCTCMRFCKSSLLCSNSFSLPLPKREPTFATNAAFVSVLAASSFSDLIPFLTSSSCCYAYCCSVCSYHTLASSSPVCLWSLPHNKRRCPKGCNHIGSLGRFSGACTALRKCHNELWLLYFQKPVRVPSSHSLR